MNDPNDDILPTKKRSRKKQGDIGYGRGLNSVFLTISLAIAGGVFIHNLESSGEHSNRILLLPCLRSALEGIDSSKHSVVPTVSFLFLVRLETCEYEPTHFHCEARKVAHQPRAVLIFR